MAAAGFNRVDKDIASTKTVYALVGSIVAGLAIWGSAIALII